MARLGILATVLSLLGGAWLFITPYAVGSQNIGAVLQNSTKSFLWSGGIVAVLAAGTLVAYGLMGAADAMRAAQKAGGAEQDKTT